MAKTPEEPKKAKKKRGCLGCLWLMFAMFLLVIAAATMFFYFYDIMVTGWGLDLYSQRMADVLTSPQYYHITDDPLYRSEAEGKEKSAGFSAAALQQKILQQRRDESKHIFKQLVLAYQQHPHQEWYRIFKQLDSQLQKIFYDEKVFPRELQDFLSQVKKISEQILQQEKAPKEKEQDKQQPK